MRNWTFLFALASGLLLVIPSTTRAQPLGSDMHLASWSGMDNQYIFRGLPQVSKGAPMRAAAEIRADFYDDDWLRVSVPIGFGIVVTPGARSEGVPNVPRAWYESRFDGGLILGFGDVTVDSRFTIYSSPNGSFNDVYELTFNLSYDDAPAWTDGDPNAIWLGFAPHVGLARELAGARDGGIEGTYIELGLRPALHIFEGGALLGVNLALPLRVGLSAGDYYEVPNQAEEMQDHTFGFASIGASLDFEARFIPRRLGRWTGAVGIDAIFPVAANDAAGPVAPDGTRRGNGVDTVELVAGARAGIAF